MNGITQVSESVSANKTITSTAIRPMGRGVGARVGVRGSSFGCQLLRRAGGDGVVEARRRSHAGVSSARDGAGGARGAIAASCRGIVISSLLRARSERVIFRSSGSGVGAELLDSSIDLGIALRGFFYVETRPVYGTIARRPSNCGVFVVVSVMLPITGLVVDAF